MADPVRLLEDRVGRAIDRLARLSRERDELRQQVESLRERVAKLEHEARTAGEGALEVWHREREQVVIAVREALSELRGE